MTKRDTAARLKCDLFFTTYMMDRHLHKAVASNAFSLQCIPSKIEYLLPSLYSITDAYVFQSFD